MIFSRHPLEHMLLLSAVIFCCIAALSTATSCTGTAGACGTASPEHAVIAASADTISAIVTRRPLPISMLRIFLSGSADLPPPRETAPARHPARSAPGSMCSAHPPLPGRSLLPPDIAK